MGKSRFRPHISETDFDETWNLKLFPTPCPWFWSDDVGGLGECTIRFLSLSFYFSLFVTRSSQCGPISTLIVVVFLYVTWRVSAQVCACWGFRWYASIYESNLQPTSPQKRAWIGIFQVKVENIKIGILLKQAKLQWWNTCVRWHIGWSGWIAL